MNKALLAKLVRWVLTQNTTLWFKVLREKYSMGERGCSADCGQVEDV